MNKLSKRAIDKIMLFLNNKEFDYITLSRRELKILFNVYQNATFEIFEIEEQLQRAVNNCKQRDEVIDEADKLIVNYLCSEEYCSLNVPLIADFFMELRQILQKYKGCNNE